MKELTGVQRLLLALAASSLVSVGFYVYGVIEYDTAVFGFLNWNLVLAWLPLIFALYLPKVIVKYGWISWQASVLTLLWLGFLPNSFYIISDLMHINAILTVNPLFYAVMIFSFSFNGLMLGFLSLQVVQTELLKRLKPLATHAIVAGVLLFCSFAVYVGRYLRWSTWDVVLNPAGVVFDVSDRFINPFSYGHTFRVTAIFFALLVSTYFVFWELIRAVRTKSI